jgi:hypothetical protein
MAIQVLPTLDRFAGVRGFAENAVSGLLQQQQNKALSQQLGQILGQPGAFQGITDPRALQLAGQLGLQQAQAQPGFSLQPGGTRFSPQGQPIASVPAAPASPESQTQFIARIADKAAIIGIQERAGGDS